MQATKQWALSGLLPPSSVVFRALVLYVLATTQFISVSQDLRALTVAHSAGQQLGLDNVDSQVADIDFHPSEAQESWQRDIDAWCVLRVVDSTLSLSASQPPGSRNYGSVKPWLGKPHGETSDLLLQDYQNKLCEINERCFEKVCFFFTGTENVSSRFVPKYS